eukprot:gene1787-2922_t
MLAHRNIANQIHHTDLSVHSILEFAISVLQVQHVIVCGHSACGGIATALQCGQ